MKRMIFPKDCNLLEGTDVKGIEGGCCCAVLSALTGKGTTGGFSVNDLICLMSIGQNLLYSLNCNAGSGSLGDSGSMYMTDGIPVTSTSTSIGW